jgi:CheY-like chemotaxis protein
MVERGVQQGIELAFARGERHNPSTQSKTSRRAITLPAAPIGKILVVDDEIPVATTLRAILEQAGYRAVVAFSGPSAIKIAQTFKPDVLLTDVMMPKMNGIEAALEIVRDVPKCSVLLYTASKVLPVDSMSKVKAQGHNFPVVEKPIEPGDLLLSIRNTIRKHRSSFQAIVLNVDDDDMQRYAVSRLLSHAGFVVREAKSGEEALKEARNHPHLILLDIKLPDMDGFEVCRRLKAAPETAHIPVVHLTNIFRDEEAKAKALAAGAEEFFTHPVHPDALFAKLRELIGTAADAGSAGTVQ